MTQPVKHAAHYASVVNVNAAWLHALFTQATLPPVVDNDQQGTTAVVIAEQVDCKPT